MALFLFGAPLIHAALPIAEHNALVDLYNSTNGASWINKTNWMVAADECTWYGITCDAGHTTVQGLTLWDDNLGGTLPSSLATLTSLQSLGLDNNQLRGSIPPELGSLTSLQYLGLSGNQLSGSIPAQLGSLSSLHELELEHNQLSGSIPAELSNLRSLQHLRLDVNRLSGSIPAQLGSLTSLQFLELGDNQLSGSIPAQLGSLTSLQYLDLSQNQLSGSIPADLGNLSGLQLLALDSNQLSGSIPPQLGNLFSLQYLLGLSENQLSGSIPAQLGNLSGLQDLSLDSNQLSGSIPPQLGSLTNLQHLYLNSNQLTGPVPAAPTSLRAGESNLCGNSLVSSGNPTIDAAWVTAQDHSVVAGGNWLACQTVSQQTPVVNAFAANPSTITVGQSSTLSWTTTNATSVSISGVTGTQPANGSASVSPTATTTYTLTATGSGAIATATTTIVVNSATPQPPGAFMLSGGAYCSAGPAPAVLLTWGASSGVATYTLYRNGAPVSGSGTNMPASQLSFDNSANVTAGTSYSYFVRATNASGYTDSNTISVPVPSNVCGSTQPPTIVFTASPDRLVGGGTTTLSWSVANATTVSIDNDLGARATSGSVIVNVGRTTQYILTAVGPGGNAFRALTVRVDPALQVTTLITPLQGAAPLTSTLQAIPSGGVPPYTSYTWSTGAHGAKATALWTTEGRYGVTCTVVDSRGNQATSPTQVVYVTNLSASVKFETLDPNPGIAGNITTSNPAILTNAPPRTGIAADGVTILLLRFTSDVPGSVKFGMGGDTCDAPTFTRTDDSWVSSWNSEVRLDSVTQHTISVGSQQQAFAVYHAPMNFVRTAADYDHSDRPLTLRAQFTPDAGAVTEKCAQLAIVRPPLLLIHGIWSGDNTWTFPLVWDGRFRTTLQSWDGYTSIANNSDTAHQGVIKALGERRALKIAATQVDLIGHSMGGLLARAWAGSSSYIRASNYNKGDYHKLITLNTPHIGSPLATAIVDLRQRFGAPLVYEFQYLLEKPISPCSAVPILGFFSWNSACGPGAIDDLQENGDVLRNLAIPNVPTHAFVGEAGVLGAGGCLTVLSAMAKSLSIWGGYFGNIDALSRATFGETTHDQMVGSVSQSGGMGLNKPTTSVSDGCDSAHTNATESPVYSETILELLNAKVSDPAFGRIDVNAMLQVNERSAVTTSGYRGVRAAVSPIVVTITSPTDGFVVEGAGSLSVQVSVSGGTVKAVSLLGDRIVLDKADPPYQFAVNLPGDSLGRVSLFALALGLDGSVAFSAPVTVEVRRNSTIESLQLDGTSRTMLFPGHDQLHVRAMFSDGILRDVTDPGLGTTYSSDDESIVSVSAAGMMTAKRPGVTVVTVRNGAAEASTFVLVVSTPGARRRAVLP